MDKVARLSARDRHDLVAATAAARSINPLIIEKDFWVCWLLKRLFALPNPPAEMIFKGGTSLSKVFDAIKRFSEDVDISFDRTALGYSGTNDPALCASNKQRQKTLAELAAKCSAMIRDQLLPMLSNDVQSCLGTAPGTDWEMTFELVNGKETDPVINFRYPSLIPATSGYIRPRVRLEMGARGEQWPSVKSVVRPYLAVEHSRFFDSPDCPVTAVTAERTFWEKATILHRCHHQPLAKPLNPYLSRHYYDVATLYGNDIGKNAVANLGLLTDVSKHQTNYFYSAAARYHEAVPGTLRLVPPSERIGELKDDYAGMQEMMFGDSPTFDEILTTLDELERLVNTVE